MVALCSRLFLTLPDFSFQELNIYSLVVFGHSSELQCAILEDTKSQHVSWSYYPHITRIDGVGKDLEKTC